MLIFRRHQSRGFTLIELAIVLGIAGLLFTGLWRLLSSGNSQMRDQTAASQQTQLLNGVSNYLQSTDGQTFLSTIGAGNKQPLLLPSVVANGGGTAGCTTDANMTAAPAHTGLCGFLPPGFYIGTPNSYGQTYSIAVLKDNTAAGLPPQSYSFMILTQGGDTIADTSGGRISALIGGDGGFVYNSDVCTANNKFLLTACGSYGSWATLIANYFTTAATAGHVASRTFYTPSQSTNNPWLARYFIAGDNAVSPEFNQVHYPANLFLGGENFYLGCDNGVGNTTGPCSAVGVTVNGNTVINAKGQIYAQGGSINMSSSGAVAGGGNINMQGGDIIMFPVQQPSPPPAPIGGTIFLNGGLISDTNTNQAIKITTGGTPLTFGSSLVQIGTACTQDSGVSVLTSTPSCNYGIEVDGDESVLGRLTANSLYAQTFIYQGSDIRLKKNIQPLNTPLDNVMRLKPVSFNFKNSDTNSMGVIAQDIEKVYPDLVSIRSDGMKAVNYEGLIAPLIGAVQELKKENESLRKQINEQAQKQQELEKRLNEE